MQRGLIPLAPPGELPLLEDVKDLFGLLACAPAGALVYPPQKWVTRWRDGDDGEEELLPETFFALL